MRYHFTISWREVVIQCVAGLVILIIPWSIGRYSDARDFEIWNGEVTETQAVKQNCPIGWVSWPDSHCTEYMTRLVQTGQSCTTSNGVRTCVPTYSTEYNYIYSWERRYYVESNIDRQYEIKRVDRQGKTFPERFTATNVGDPVSKTNPYYKWVTAVNMSVFNKHRDLDQETLDLIGEYPIKIYDYWRVDRVRDLAGVLSEDELKAANHKLANALKRLGPTREMNAVIVIYPGNFPDDFPHRVEAAWNGFKKNDAVVFLGVSDTGVKPAVLSWSKNNSFNVELRDALTGPFDINQTIEKIAKYGDLFERHSMEEFAYLKEEIPPPLWLYLTMLFLAIASSIGFTYVFHKHDVL